MMTMMRLILPLTVLLLLTASLFSAGRADAKTSRKVSHSYERVWPTTVRFLRIDEGLKIVEKDSETGYVLFELEDEGKIFSGSVEVVRRRDSSKRDAVELILNIHKRPSYMEHAILDRMLLKIQDELGRPKSPPRKKAPPKKEAPPESPPTEVKSKAP